MTSVADINLSTFPLEYFIQKTFGSVSSYIATVTAQQKRPDPLPKIRCNIDAEQIVRFVGIVSSRIHPELA